MNKIFSNLSICIVYLCARSPFRYTDRQMNGERAWTHISLAKWWKERSVRVHNRSCIFAKLCKQFMGCDFDKREMLLTRVHVIDNAPIFCFSSFLLFPNKLSVYRWKMSRVFSLKIYANNFVLACQPHKERAKPHKVSPLSSLISFIQLFSHYILFYLLGYWTVIGVLLFTLKYQRIVNQYTRIVHARYEW